VQRHHERNAGVSEWRVPLCAAGEHYDKTVVDRLLYGYRECDAFSGDEEAGLQDAVPAGGWGCEAAGWTRGVAEGSRCVDEDGDAGDADGIGSEYGEDWR